MKNVLTIAGHDLSSGAGIGKDAEIFSALGCHPLAVPTALVIQGPRGVRRICPVPADSLKDMLDTVKEEIRPDGIKIGVTCDADQVAVIADFLDDHKGRPIVLDPVLSAKNNRQLLSRKGVELLIERILPRVDVVTPNSDEAVVLTGNTVADREGMKEAALALRERGAKGALMKGGHLQGDPSDMLLFGEGPEIWWQRPRLERIVHGTGCTLSSLLLGFIVQGYSPGEAFREAETAMGEVLKNAYRIGEEGYYYTSLTFLKIRSAERWEVVSALLAAVEKLKCLDMAGLIPEVQMNIGYAVAHPEGTEDVAAFPGRIGHHERKILVKGQPQFGASSHVARLILTMMKTFPWIRACANVRYTGEIPVRARERGWNVIFVDRREEPDSLKEEEGKSLDFLMNRALKGASTPPDIVYDLGDQGKEPIVRLFARHPEELLHKMEIIQPWKIR